MKINTLAQWYGADRMVAKGIANLLGKCDWVGIPFCGGCSVIPHIQTRAGVANDLHAAVINLARVVSDANKCAELVHQMEDVLYHETELEEAQKRCSARDGDMPTGDVQWAMDYFISVWMGRGGAAGTPQELTQCLSVRYSASGGDSCVRFRSAVAGLLEWHTAVKQWTFVCSDAFDMIAAVGDNAGSGLYVDAPWVEEGSKYCHGWSSNRPHARLAEALHKFKNLRLVVRYADHSLIRQLYPEGLWQDGKWQWLENPSRSQSNGRVNEVLIFRKPFAEMTT